MIEYNLREVQDDDMSFLREMLYEAVFWRECKTKPSFEEGLAYPDVGKAVTGLGQREGDIAVVAISSSARVGAAWLRYWTDDNNIRGYYEESTPVLVIGVHSNYRHRGIGKKMIEWLIDYASKNEIEKISLCVSKDNYALNLYKQSGFEEYKDTGDSLIMVYKL